MIGLLTGTGIWLAAGVTDMRCGMDGLAALVQSILAENPFSDHVFLFQGRPKLACACCDTIVQAPAASRPIANGLTGPGLLAHVLTAKFCDHLPLYRQSGIYARSGVELERSTLADWVGQCSALLRPLVDALNRYVLSAAKVHADDTPVPILAPGEGKTKTGRLWPYVRDDRPAGDPSPPAVWFAYSPNRRGEHPQAHLKAFAGIVQADAYAGYDALYADGKILQAACWAHARRKFFESHKAQASPIDAEALKRIAALYAIEAEVRGQIAGSPTPHSRGESRTVARPLQELADGNTGQPLAEIDPGRGYQLCAQALAGADALRRRRAHRDRQQRRRARLADGGHWPEELSLCRLRRRRRARCGNGIKNAPCGRPDSKVDRYWV